MTLYEELMSKAYHCLDRAKECKKKGEVDLANFLFSAYNGFKKKANNLTVKEATKGVIR